MTRTTSMVHEASGDGEECGYMGKPSRLRDNTKSIKIHPLLPITPYLKGSKPYSYDKHNLI